MAAWVAAQVGSCVLACMRGHLGEWADDQVVQGLRAATGWRVGGRGGVIRSGLGCVGHGWVLWASAWVACMRGLGVRVLSWLVGAIAGQWLCGQSPLARVG